MAAKKPAPERIEPWELHLIGEFAWKVERHEPEELQAELARQLLAFKYTRPMVDDWRNYLPGFLERKFSSWRKARARRQKRLVAFDNWSEEDGFHESRFSAALGEPDPGTTEIELRLWREHLPAKLRRLWDILSRDRITLAAAARRLHKHPNTVRAWVRKIRQALAAPPEPLRRVVQSLTLAPSFARRRVLAKRQISVSLSLSFLTAVLRLPLTGTEWRILLKVILEADRRKQRMIPFTWYAIAAALSSDRSGVRRAGRHLVRRGLLFVRHGRIGVDRSIAHWEKGDRPLR
jgi:hypothetical protein